MLLNDCEINVNKIIHYFFSSKSTEINGPLDKLPGP